MKKVYILKKKKNEKNPLFNMKSVIKPIAKLLSEPEPERENEAKFVEVGVGAEAETKTFQLHNTGLCSINVFL